MDIAAAKKRCEAATEGEWKNVRGIDGGIVCDINGEAWDITDDADFIAHARSDLPAALEALEEARGLLRDIPHAYKCSTYDDGGACDCHRAAIAVFLRGSKEDK